MKSTRGRQTGKQIDRQTDSSNQGENNKPISEIRNVIRNRYQEIEICSGASPTPDKHNKPSLDLQDVDLHFDGSSALSADGLVYC